jgi:hypothetical protein
MKISLMMILLTGCTQQHVFNGHVTPEHRPLSEIDIQGHMEYGPRRPCPAVFDAPDGNLRQCL